VVGNPRNANLIVVYLHGQGGSRRQGVDDFTFGGNFNRIKNLAVMAGGVYLSPDFSDFEEKGADQIAALISLYAAAAPHAPIFIACGSAGGQLCWRLAHGNEMSKRLGGLLLLGSLWDEKFLSSAAFRRRVPVYLGQGSNDPVFPVERMEEFYRMIRRKAPGYPGRMVRFETGSHGTPIRMIDWRETINWMLSARR
jgi:pimeloyl-ACP methyl ester carboxylesterase